MRYAGGAEVLHQLNLSLSRGELVYLMGPTGAGKSSLLRLLGLLQMPSQGELSLFGRNVAHLTRDEQSAFRRRIGMVFQDARLLEHLSGYDNVALPLRLHGARDDQIHGLVREMLTWLGFSAALDAKPCSLSLGQRQLIAVARAIISRPELLLCDEPTSNLDGKRARRLMHLLTQLRKLGTTVVLATHSDDLVERYRHPVLRLNNGYLSEPGPSARPIVATGDTPSARNESTPPRSAVGSDRTAAPMREAARGGATSTWCLKQRRRHLRRVQRRPRPRRRRAR
jgi:cell division transport system ATP-binding protein